MSQSTYRVNAELYHTSRFVTGTVNSAALVHLGRMSAMMRADCTARTSTHAFASTSRAPSFRPCRLTKPQRARTQQVRATGECRRLVFWHSHLLYERLIANIGQTAV